MKPSILTPQSSLLAAAAALVLLAGCADLSERDPAVVRVLEYGAGGGLILNRGEVGGCSIHQAESAASADGKGSVRFVLVYSGQKCQAQVQSK